MKQNQLLKYIKGETSPQEDVEVYEWIASDDQNRRDYEHLRHIYDALLCSEEPLAVASDEPHGAARWLRGVAAAAVVAVCAGGGYLASALAGRGGGEYLAGAPRSIYVPVGQRAEVVLDDGTHVWLNSNSTLEVGMENREGGMRCVSLDGEAYFDVARDEEHPFVVRVGQREIKVLGTSFDVSSCRSREDFSLKLFTGKVCVTDTETNKSVTFEKGTRLVGDADGMKMYAMAASDTIVWWKDGIYHFDDCEYDEIFRLLEERFKVSFNVRNQAVLHYRCSSKFHMEDGVEHIVRTLQHIHRFKYEWNDTDRVFTIS